MIGIKQNHRLSRVFKCSQKILHFQLIQVSSCFMFSPLPRMIFSSCLLHSVPILLILWSSNNSLIASSSNESDKLALLAFKGKITSDPRGALRTWNDSSHYCEWNGVTCSSRHRDRVTILDLQDQNLEGTLSPHIGNLSFLRIIALTGNYFHGSVPQEIGRLFRLQELYFYSNSFSSIPSNLTQCTNLTVLRLGKNNFSGRIPVELTSLSKLTELGLSQNKLNGRIPPSLGNLSSLTQLFLDDNSLTGNIPDELCNIGNLEQFVVSVNHLTGRVPSCLYNLSHITEFAIAANKLNGSLPSNIGLTLPNLEALIVGGNQFKGLIPLSLPNASKLEIIDFGENQFTGQVPKDLGMIQGLRYLSFVSNHLGTTSGDDLNFIISLTNCAVLGELSVGNNSLKGTIPNAIANLSTHISLINLGRNQIYGSIPAGIENLVNLTVLILERNDLTGEIPKAIGMFPKMNGIYLHHNQFSGKIPDSFVNATQLQKLDLSDNNLYGILPPSLGYCQNLFELNLSNNNLSGNIPKQIVSLSSLTLLLDFSNNALSGPLPLEIGNLSNLVKLDVSKNRLNGNIPDTIGGCLMLVFLDISDNSFKGNIPQSLSSLKSLENLNFSHNKFSGEIPKYLRNLTFLTDLDLSYNELEGPVPKGGVFENASEVAIVGNSKLCGGASRLRLPPCRTKTLRKRKSISPETILPVAVVSLAILPLLCCSVYMLHQIIKSRKQRTIPRKEATPLSLFNYQSMRISYSELLKATNNFSVDNLVGVGSYGSVYKGVLAQTNTMVAVKVLNLQQRGASKSFLSECNALRNLRHRNLLKIITCCSSVDYRGNDFKALVFEFMPNGSLEEWLHPKSDEQHGLRNLNFLQRLNIAIDIASALDYLHHHCQPAIVHCDLKPSNVLLDDEMTAHVADFGLAKFFSSTSSSYMDSQGSSAAIEGSIGYVAPEYGMGCDVSSQRDVYSYGILLLEMFTGKRPTDAIFQNGLSLHKFSKLDLPTQVMNIVDPVMLLEDHRKTLETEIQDIRGRMQECLVSAIELGVACSAESPMERMDMEEVVIKLAHIKDYYQGAGISSG